MDVSMTMYVLQCMLVCIYTCACMCACVCVSEVHVCVFKLLKIEP